LDENRPIFAASISGNPPETGTSRARELITLDDALNPLAEVDSARRSRC